MFRDVCRFAFVSILLLLVLQSCKQGDDSIVWPTEDHCQHICRDRNVSLSKELSSIDSLLKTKTGVCVLDDGGKSLVSRAWLSEYAEKTIDIQYFIFSMDNIGLIACDYLVRAADRGVKVRILVDDLMVDADPQDIAVLDAHPNIDIRIYNPGLNIGKNILGKIKTLATDFRGANQRMHNKTFIVDGSVVITGGRNLADEYYDFDHEYNFRDRDILVLGKEVSAVQSSFTDFWQSKWSVPVSILLSEEYPEKYDPKHYEGLKQYACDPANFWPSIRDRIDNLPQTFSTLRSSGDIVWADNVSFVSDDPGKNDGTQGLGGGGISTDTLIQLIRSAKKSINIQSPYLVTTELGRSLFADAVARGVEVRILTNSLASTDNLEAFSGYQKERDKLLEAGVRIFEFKPDAPVRKRLMTKDLQETLDFQPIFGLHAKSMVIDDEISVIGTFNLDPRSANLNTECLVIVESDIVAAKIMRHMEEEFAPENAWETTKEWNPDKEVKRSKRLKTWMRKAVPKNIL